MQRFTNAAFGWRSGQRDLLRRRVPGGNPPARLQGDTSSTSGNVWIPWFHPDPRNHMLLLLACCLHEDSCMYDLHAIEAINIDQLATATDRLLLRGPRVKRRAASTTYRSLAAAPIPRKRPSWSRFAHAAMIAGVFSLTAALVGVL